MLWKWMTGVTLLSLIMLSAVLSRDLFAPGGDWGELSRSYGFSITRWELGNLFDKWEYRLKQIYRLTKLSEEDKVNLVESYLSLAQEINLLENRLNRTKAEETGSVGDITQWEKELQALTRERDSLEDQVEEIIEGQISRALAEEGLSITFKLGGIAELLFPPVDFEFEENPNLLIISPRHKIELITSILLEPTLSLEEIMNIEVMVAEQGFSALVERTGGVAAYPSIVPQVLGLDSILSTVAHEWLHHYLFFRPLGRNYWSSYDMTTINETVAGIAGDEIGALVHQRYYREERKEATPLASGAEPAFDFNKEMREIRLAVDQYLAGGEVEEAERFMEQKRQFLAANGYYIRKLNQAYFAFHGTYADSPTSVSPIGGELRELRERSPSLGAFIRTVAQISSYEELQMMLQE